MKIYPITIAFLIASLMSACGNSKPNKAMENSKIPLIPEIIGSTYTTQLISQDGLDTVESSWKYEFYSTPKNAWQDSVNYKIGNFVSSFTVLGEEDYVHKPLSHDYFANCINQFVKDCEESNKESEYPMIWSVEGVSEIKSNLKEYVQVNQSVYVFTGGAHPNSLSINELVLKKDGRTMKLKDLVTDLSKFNQIAEKHFRIAREIGSDVNIAEEFPFFENGVFACNDNFHIDKEGISFLFNAYEIASYAQGITEFTIPMKEIKHLLAVELVFE